MLPGGGAMHLVDSLGRCRDLEFVSMLHEQSAAIAAEAYGRYTNNLGVAMVTTGPGGTNAVTGVAGAWLASTPCLFISGQVKRADLKGDSGVRQIGPQELDIVAIVKPITKYAIMVTDPSTIRYHLEKAAILARTGRKGPVWIDIPLDVQAALIEPDSLPGFNAAAEQAALPGKAALSEIVAAALRIFNKSERPVLLLGNGVHYAGAERDVLRLANLLNIPVLTTWIAADLLPDSHPLFLGRPGTVASRYANFTVQNSDCLIAIGARLDFDVTGFNQRMFARAAAKIVVDIDECELRKFNGKMTIDLPVAADAGDFIRELLRQAEGIAPVDRSAWRARCVAWKQRYPVVLREYWETPHLINMYVFTTLLCEELPEDAVIIPGSSGAAIDAFWQTFGAKSGQRAFSTGGLGAMGFGIPAAIGGCIASGKKRTITVDGDGGFIMNVQELAVVAARRLPIKFFVMNNGGYASIRAMQRNHFKSNFVASGPGSGLFLPETVRIAASYGIPSTKFTDQATLRERIREVLAADGPMIAEVMLDPEQTLGPRASSAVRPDGSMVSKPLEDLAPFLDRAEFAANMIIPPSGEEQ
jgi:acetolactate synthase-1/2/3 large subunit